MIPDLRTRYLGMELSGPVVASASPMTGEPEQLRQLQAAGVSAVVLPSLFEEQIEHEELALVSLHELAADASPEANGYVPDLIEYKRGPDDTLRLISQAKRTLSIPIIASLNGSSAGGWVRYSQLMADAGADAIELNVYFVPTDVEKSGQEVERRYVELVSAVRAAVHIPLAVKIGPGFSSPGHLALQLVRAGADGLVLFNRYLRPDVDLETLQLVPRLMLSSSYDLRIPLMWIGLLRDRTTASLAASSGVHTAFDVLKVLLVGADVAMVTSSVLRQGAEHVRTLLSGLSSLMEEKEYASIDQLKGSLCRERCPDPSAYERANYMRTLVSYSGGFV